MNHCATQRIETERLILRRYTLEDAPAMYRNWASDPEVTKYLTWPKHSSPAVSRAVLEGWVPNYAKEDYYHWAIVLKENGAEPIGDIAAVSLEDSSEKVQIGYCIGRNWWRRGITSEALAAVTDFFFEKVGANRIEARHDPRNPNSGKVMEKCGMKYEGTLRSSDKNNRGICDACYYSILRSERATK